MHRMERSKVYILKISNMEKYFVTYDQALALKELGFDEPCFGYYNMKKKFNMGDYTTKHWKSTCLAPLYQQAFRWFREEHGLWFRPDFYDEMKTYDYQGSIHKLGRFSSLASLDNHKTVEELESACIDKLIELIKNK